jgi:hypothetical protein
MKDGRTEPVVRSHLYTAIAFGANFDLQSRQASASNSWDSSFSENPNYLCHLKTCKDLPSCGRDLRLIFKIFSQCIVDI